ncbi:MAG TPA: hypothetical protein VK779_09955, partial [Rhizomicrobium sp.]|nr:hypothetical protein [Rhizomicrobium sp.]
AITIHKAIQPAPEILPWPEKSMAEELDEVDAGQPIHAPDVLFAKITDEQVEAWKQRFGGAE